jgi:hypothetical protein
MSSAPPRSSNDPAQAGGTATAREMAALVDEVAEAATAITNYIHAIKRLHSVGGRSEVGQIDAILDKAEEQLQRLRTSTLTLHMLAGIRSREP